MILHILMRFVCLFLLTKNENIVLSENFSPSDVVHALFLLVKSRGRSASVTKIDEKKKKAVDCAFLLRNSEINIKES
jgi:hypothetical protein